MACVTTVVEGSSTIGILGYEVNVKIYFTNYGTQKQILLYNLLANKVWNGFDS